MPYQIKTKGAGYVVKNVRTGKEYSGKAMSRRMALRQLAVLQRVAKSETL